MALSRKIVGWAVAAAVRTEDLPLQALNHAVAVGLDYYVHSTVDDHCRLTHSDVEVDEKG